MKLTSVWIDHHKAYIFDYLSGGIEQRTMESHLNHNGKVSHEDLRKFYHSVANSLTSSEKILVVGPGTAKDEFKHHCQDHHKNINKAIIKLETMKDHPTPEEILKVSNMVFKEEIRWKGI